MSNPLTKYVAAAALAGAVAFGGFTIAGAQDSTPSTATTAPTEQSAPQGAPEGTQQAPPSGEAPATPDGTRPPKGNCDQDKGGGAAGSSAESTPSAPSTGSSNTTTESSNSTNT